METSRMVRSSFWKDSFVQGNLNPLDRYLFLYLLTNERTNISGIYEIPMKFIAMETGIDISELDRSMFPRLSEKIAYIDGWVVIKNFQKHQSLKSALIKKGIFNELSRVPEKVLKQAISIGYIDHIYTICIPLQDTKEDTKGNTKVQETACAVSAPRPSGDGKWDEVKDSKKYIDELRASDRESYKIVGSYLNLKKVTFPSREIAERVFSRNIRSATELAEYDPNARNRALSMSAKRTKEWTLETVLKYLQK
jgi:hypothetical protein